MLQDLVIGIPSGVMSLPCTDSISFISCYMLVLRSQAFKIDVLHFQRTVVFIGWTWPSFCADIFAVRAPEFNIVVVLLSELFRMQEQPM